MTASEVKARYQSLQPSGHFFDRDTLRFFGQTMRSFSITYLGEDKYLISAPMYARERNTRRYMGMSKHVFDYVTGNINPYVAS